jgi:hypothetical protein
VAVDTFLPVVQTLTVTDTSSKLTWDVRRFSAGSIQVVPSTVSGAWTVTIYGSNDGTTPDTLESSVTITSAGSGLSRIIDLSGIGHLHAKITVAGSSGTLLFYLCAKAEAGVR